MVEHKHIPDTSTAEEIKSFYEHPFGRNPLFADIPLNTVITEEMRTERLQNPLRFPYRKFSCLVCGDKAEYCGSRPIFDNAYTMVVTGTQYLFYCKTCDANIEYLRLNQK